MKRKAERRVYFVKGDLGNYQNCVKTYQQRLVETRRLVTNAMLEQFSISQELWNRSAEFYTNNPILAPQLHSIITIFPYKHMLIKSERYNELKKQEMYQMLVTIAEKKEDIMYQMFMQFKADALAAQDIPEVLEEHLTKMYDDIWVETGLEEEEIFNDFYDHKCSFNSRYIETRDASWRRLAAKLATE